jgi:hypothetical protein
MWSRYHPIRDHVNGSDRDPVAISALVYSTYLGGSGSDQALGIAV